MTTGGAADGRSGRPPAARRYGQHHLVDRGTLDAIVALGDVQRDDVVLEVGAADGVLTRRLLAQAAHVHAFEIDRRFISALQLLSSEHAHLSVHVTDALKTDLGALRPSPTLFAANLAYNIAIPVIMKSLAELPGLRRWAVMVQKELADRLFAQPSTKAYAAVSVLVQLTCRKIAARPIPRTVFSPRPRVDSAFVVFERITTDAELGGVANERDRTFRPPWSTVERVVRLAFAQRRKMLANALAGGRTAGRRLSAEEVRSALERMGLSPTVRAEELTPERFPELARELMAARSAGGGGEVDD